MIRTLSAVFVLLFVGVASAAPPSVEAVLPGVAQRGTEVTLTLTGARLTEPRELLFYGDGLTCTKLAAGADGEVIATVKVAADCRLGEHVFRLATRGGVSELRTLRVTQLPVVKESADDNDTPAHAQAVPLNVSVAGVIEPGDVDCYKVTLKKGQRLSAEVEAVRLGSPTLDAVLTVYGPDGKVVAEVDDAPLFRQDPFLSLIAPADGVYVLTVRDTADGGGAADRYALHVGTFPRPAAVFPAGGPLGAQIPVTLYGVPGGEVALTVRPTGTAFELFPADAVGTAPTPNPFRVSPFPNVLESDKPIPARWPVAFNGIIEKPNDTDDFALSAAKGDTLEVAAYAYRIGSPLDPVVSVFDASGALVARGDDDETHDSCVRFTAPADGTYTVRVADKRGQAGPRFIYRVEVTKPNLGLAVFLATASRKSQDGHVLVVPRGGRTAAFLAVRRDSIDGEVKLSLEGLPEGVALTGKPIAMADEYLIPVVLDASMTAQPGAKLIEVTGTGGGATGKFTQTATLVNGPGDSTLHSVTVSKLCVAVVDAVPYSVAVERPATALPADGSLAVKLTVTRAKDFTEALEVTFPCLPPGVEAPLNVVIPPDKSEAVVTLESRGAAEVGEWPLVVEAQVARAGRANRDPLLVGMNGLGTGTPPPGGRRSRRATADGFPAVSSDLIRMQVAESPKGAFAAAAGEQGKTLKVVCKFDVPLSLPGDFTAKLGGLPPRAVAKPVALKPATKEVEFEVTLDATTPPGPHPSLVCELSGTVAGQTVLFRVGRGGALKVDVPGGAKTDANGKPLTALQALRKEAAEKKQ